VVARMFSAMQHLHCNSLSLSVSQKAPNSSFLKGEMGNILALSSVPGCGFPAGAAFSHGEIVPGQQTSYKNHLPGTCLLAASGGRSARGSGSANLVFFWKAALVSLLERSTYSKGLSCSEAAL